MSTPNIDTLMRKCRFQPQMGGNREEIVVPCTLMARLLTLATMATGDPSIERAVAMMDEAELCEREAESLLREGVKVTVRPYVSRPY